jgi:hypothetical protein
MREIVAGRFFTKLDTPFHAASLRWIAPGSVCRCDAWQDSGIKEIAMKNTPAVIAAGMMLAFGSTAFADDTAGPPGPPAFNDVDADGDQMITQEEFRTFLEERRAEHRRRHAERSGKFDPFQHADTDQDGILNQQEFEGMMDKMHHFKMKFRERRGADPVE